MDVTQLLARDRAARPRKEHVEDAVSRSLAGKGERQVSETLRDLRTRADARAAGGDRARASGARAHGGERREDPVGDAPVGDVAPVDAEPEATPPEAQELPIVATISTKKQVVSGLGCPAFGQMDPTFTLVNVKQKVKKGKVHVSATLNCHYHWGVNSGGHPDVASGTEDFITADNYEDVANDLDPDVGDEPGVANYATYWSKKATEDHEKEHARDDWEGFIKPTGKALAKAKLEEQRVKSDSVDADLNKLITQGGAMPRHPGLIPSAIMAASDAHYGLPADYYSRAGEIKAHAVGAKVERPLVKKIRAHGAKLKKKAEKAEKKALKKAAKKNPSRDRVGDESVDRTVRSLMGMFG